MMYYAQLYRQGKGVYAKHQDEDTNEDFAYWAGFNEDPEVLLSWVKLVGRAGDRIEIWSGSLYADMSFVPDDPAPSCAFELALAN